MTYVLKIGLDKDTQIDVGKLKNLRFERGVYFYVGSARKNVAARITRHYSKNKKIFWHIDYLLSWRHAVLKTTLVHNDNNECQTAQFLYKNGYSFVKSFGSSDCRCPAHLFFARDGNDRKLERLLVQRNFQYADKNSF